jgi:hypothetical protein
MANYIKTKYKMIKQYGMKEWKVTLQLCLKDNLLDRYGVIDYNMENVFHEFVLSSINTIY